MRVLIAEDSRTQRCLLERTLANWGHEVVAACDGEEAWEHLTQPNAPRLAILDWMMPGMDGPEVCRKFREAFAARPTYIILLTSKTERADVIEGLQAGADNGE